MRVIDAHGTPLGTGQGSGPKVLPSPPASEELAAQWIGIESVRHRDVWTALLDTNDSIRPRSPGCSTGAAVRLNRSRADSEVSHWMFVGGGNGFPLVGS